jgi:RNA polymerase sigma factor (sigma-70 family)
MSSAPAASVRPGFSLDRDPVEPAAAARVREWYQAHGLAVYGFLRFHLPSADEADDLTAEVFLRAVRAAHQFDPGRGTVRGWLLGIARHGLADHRRREGRRRMVPAGALRDLCCEAPSPEERLLREERVAGLLAAVARLAPRHQELIGLRYGSGLDTAETAAVLGVREAVVRTRLWRALGRLRREIEP